MENDNLILNNKLRKKRDIETPSLPIKNILISDAKTGFVVLECIYKWSETANTTNLGSLILSFYQFAREVDDGGLIILFFSFLFFSYLR